jgi:hypothetical protein
LYHEISVRVKGGPAGGVASHPSAKNALGWGTLFSGRADEIKGVGQLAAHVSQKQRDMGHPAF